MPDRLSRLVSLKIASPYRHSTNPRPVACPDPTDVARPRASSLANASRGSVGGVHMVRRSGNRTHLAFNAVSAISLIASGRPASRSMSIASRRSSRCAKYGLGLWNRGGGFRSRAMA